MSDGKLSLNTKMNIKQISFNSSDAINGKGNVKLRNDDKMTAKVKNIHPT